MNIAPSHCASPTTVHRVGNGAERQLRPRRSSAFSLVELLVVIGIIFILVALLLPTVQSMQNQAKARQTRVTFSQLSSMLRELNAVNNLSTIPTILAPYPTPTDVTPGGADRNGAAVIYTRQVMNQMLTLQTNKTAMSQIPGNQIYTDSITVSPAVTGPVLLDGWGNPIIFVPVSASGPPAGSMVVHVMKVDSGTVGQTASMVSSRTQNIADVTNRPYFASAGPDGNFDLGDDNLYSFDP